MSDPLERVMLERAKQDAKWGVDRDLDHYVWLAILTEEVGEVADAALRNNDHDVRAEVVQACAVALAWLENIERRLAHPLPIAGMRGT